MGILLVFALLQDELRDRRGIVHCHSHRSHDSKGTDDEIARAAEAAGVDFVCMTDHHTAEGVAKGLEGRRGQILFIKGAELKRIVALNLKEPLKAKDTQGQIDETLKQGGLAFLSHIEETPRLEDYRNFTGIELYNLHADADEPRLQLAAKVAPWLKDDAEHSYLAFFNLPIENLRRWDELLKSRKTPAVAGNDAHQNVRVGNAQLDPYERSMRFVSTHILARKVEPKEILEALAAGRSYIAFDLLGDPKGFDFKIGRHDMGDEFAYERSAIDVRLPKRAVIRLMRDGREIAMARTDRLERPLKTPGIYRVEVYTTYKSEVYPWIYSNPIYVRPGGPSY